MGSRLPMIMSVETTRRVIWKAPPLTSTSNVVVFWLTFDSFKYPDISMFLGKVQLEDSTVHYKSFVEGS